MLSAGDVAKRFTEEMDKTGICQAVVPVSGLLALTARTLRQSEFVALEKLSSVDAAELAGDAGDRDLQIRPVHQFLSRRKLGEAERQIRRFFALHGIYVSRAEAGRW